jgi:hypothetical protein
VNTVSVTCISWQGLHSGSLIGRASVRFNALGLIVHEIEVHRAAPRLWIAPPSTAVVIDDELIRDAQGEIQYRPALSFGPPAVIAILDAIRSYDPTALAGGRGRHDPRGSAQFPRLLRAGLRHAVGRSEPPRSQRASLERPRRL